MKLFFREPLDQIDPGIDIDEDIIINGKVLGRNGVTDGDHDQLPGRIVIRMV